MNKIWEYWKDLSRNFRNLIFLVLFGAFIVWVSYQYQLSWVAQFPIMILWWVEFWSVLTFDAWFPKWLIVYLDFKRNFKPPEGYEVKDISWLTMERLEGDVWEIFVKIMEGGSRPRRRKIYPCDWVLYDYRNKISKYKFFHDARRVLE